MKLSKTEQAYMIALAAALFLIIVLLLFFFAASKEAEQKEVNPEQQQTAVEEEAKDNLSEEAGDADVQSEPEENEPKETEPEEIGPEEIEPELKEIESEETEEGFQDGGADDESAGLGDPSFGPDRNTGRSSSDGEPGGDDAEDAGSKIASSGVSGGSSDVVGNFDGSQDGKSGSADGSGSSSAGSNGKAGKDAGRSSSDGDGGSKGEASKGSSGSNSTGGRSGSGFWHGLFHTPEPAPRDGDGSVASVPSDVDAYRVDGKRGSPSDGAKELRRIEKELEKARAADKKGDHKKAFELACSVCSDIRQGDYQRVGVDGEGKQANQFEGMLKEAFQLAEENGRDLSLESPEDEGPLFIEF